MYKYNNYLGGNRIENKIDNLKKKKYQAMLDEFEYKIKFIKGIQSERNQKYIKKDVQNEVIKLNKKIIYQIEETIKITDKLELFRDRENTDDEKQEINIVIEKLKNIISKIKEIEEPFKDFKYVATRNSTITSNNDNDSIDENTESDEENEEIEAVLDKWDEYNQEIEDGLLAIEEDLNEALDNLEQMGDVV